MANYDLGISSEEFGAMTTFVTFDFFEFETQMSPLGLGLKPHYGHTSRSVANIYALDMSYIRMISSYTICRASL